MRKFIAGLALSGLLASAAQAEFLGFGAGMGIWSAEPSGDAQYEGDAFNLKRDAGLSSENSLYMWAYLNHPVPVIPNLRLERSSLSFDGSAKQTIAFGDETFGVDADTTLDLTQTDVLLYWGFPLPLVSIDFGLGAKLFDGELAMSSVGQSEKTDLDFVLPVGYLAVAVPIPGTGVTLEADTKMIRYSGSSFSDSRLTVSWVPLSLIVDLAIEAGYRTQKIDIDGLSGVDADADVTVGGLFMGAALRF